MKVKELKNYKVPEYVISSLENKNITKLNPVQIKAINQGVLDSKNILVCSPTASGKTLIASLAAAKKLVDRNSKVIYTVPLKSLANEKYKSYKEFFKGTGINVGISTGDLDSKSAWLEKHNFLILTVEKLDSLIRHGAPWIPHVKLLVVDEIHLLNDASRGPTLEIVITLLRKLIKDLQVVGLSATIGNPDELAEWLDAEVVLDDWRPVKLYQGVFECDDLDFFDKKEVLFIDKLIADPTLRLALDTIKRGKQALIFCSTKKIAESTSDKLSRLIKVKDSRLKKLADKSLKALSRPTRQCNQLASCLEKGVSFHHAGLVSKQKELIEDAFRNKVIKIICCTPTLCLSSDTSIWQNLNRTPIYNLNEGDPIFGLNNNKIELTKVKELNEMKAPNKMIKITSCCGYNINVTPNHTMLIKRKNKKLECQASEIYRGDKIATVNRLLIKEKEVRWKEFIRDNDIPFKNEVLPREVFYLIGAMLGDGYSGAETNERGINYKGSPTIVGIDNEIFERIKDVCKKYKIHFKENKNYYGTPQLILTKSKWFREFLVRCGVDIGAKKHIAKPLKTAPSEKLIALLQGLYDTDGYVERNGKIGFSNISLKLIRDIQLCLLRYSIITAFRQREKGYMQIFEKKYKTKEHYELSILQKKCMFDFASKINFGLSRKRATLSELLQKRSRDLLSISCKNCDYILHANMLSGRTKIQEEWAKNKIKIIKCLGNNKELGSRELTRRLGVLPRKKETRINHHYDLISKRRIGSRSNTEWFWSLNDIGKWVYKNILLENKNLKEELLQREICPLCSKKLDKQLRRNWRKNDFDGDIFWDIIKEIKYVDSKTDKVYDVVLDKAKDGFFVANGFLVHNSMGINLPADRAIMKSLKRYSGRFGSDWIPVLEYHQMTGRAGRP